MPEFPPKRIHESQQRHLRARLREYPYTGLTEPKLAVRVANATMIAPSVAPTSGIRSTFETRDELTAQETQIARLAGDGLSNSQIAKALWVTEHLTDASATLLAVRAALIFC